MSFNTKAFILTWLFGAVIVLAEAPGCAGRWWWPIDRTMAAISWPAWVTVVGIRRSMGVPSPPLSCKDGSIAMHTK